MMPSEIVAGKGIPKRYIRWTEEVLQRIGPDISYRHRANEDDPPNSYRIQSIVRRIHLLSKEEFEDYRTSGEVAPFLISGKAPTPDIYGTAATGRVDLYDLYGNFADVKLDTSLGYWTPVSADYPGKTEGHIFLCIDRIRKKVQDLRGRVPEVDKRYYEKMIFRIVLLHELGHHYCFANFDMKDIPRKDILDLFIVEGLADWFANMEISPEERFIQAELALDLSPWHRIFLFLKLADIRYLLDVFLKKADYALSPSAFSQVIGGKYNFNGHLMNVGGEFNGVVVDWSGKGGSIIAGKSIKAIMSVNHGCFITPHIKFLSGRFPRNVLIIANSIEKIHDYGYLPDNIKIVKTEDIAEVLKRNRIKDGRYEIKNILTDLDIDESWIRKFSDRSSETTEWARAIDEAVERDLES